MRVSRIISGSYVARGNLPTDSTGTVNSLNSNNSENRVRPVHKTIPVSVGGSSDEAYRIGGSLGDIFGLWGEPLKETKEQIDRIYAEAEKAGRVDRPRIWVNISTYCC